MCPFPAFSAFPDTPANHLRASTRSACCTDSEIQFDGAVTNSIGVLIQPVSFSPCNPFIA